MSKAYRNQPEDRFSLSKDGTAREQQNNNNDNNYNLQAYVKQMKLSSQ